MKEKLTEYKPRLFLHPACAGTTLVRITKFRTPASIFELMCSKMPLKQKDVLAEYVMVIGEGTIPH